jgi:4-(gamma-glutamylamino)butanal dehydrogenase
MTQTEIDGLCALPVAPRELFIDGNFEPAIRVEGIDLVSPRDGKAFPQIAAGSAGDVDKAIVAARARFAAGKWAGAVPSARKKVLFRIAALIETHALEVPVPGGVTMAPKLRWRSRPASSGSTPLAMRQI